MSKPYRNTQKTKPVFKRAALLGSSLFAAGLMTTGAGALALSETTPASVSYAASQSNGSSSAPQSFKVTRDYIEDKCVGAVGIRRWHNKYHGPQSADFKTSRISVYPNGDVRFSHGGRYPEHYSFNILQVSVSYNGEGNYVLVSSSSRRIVVAGDQTAAKAYIACNKSRNVAKAFSRLKTIARSNQKADPFD